ncbi:hypothetical protein NQ318_006724 [Aromia moschata]|uniref:Pre-rRNA-processing protein RIX1 N-terminal domain-containing protein n=1 Tax=Aromia moschata TaxID=1265417 RepID=A0AAV8YCI2_9CUCU|nr:hypothetical protein NQ318_006724 [Aromia moschata]
MPLRSSQIEEAISTTDVDIKILLANILNLNLQNSSSEKAIIQTINKLVSVSRTRLQGLEFLNLIINNCSKSIITENSFNWLSHCLVKHASDDLKEIKLTTLGKIIENAHSEQEFNKRFVSDYMSKVFENCVSTHTNLHETEAALNTLTICMKNYPSWFSHHKNKVEDFIVTFLESPSERHVEKAGSAFLYLQQVGSAGLDGINHKSNFSESFAKLCSTVQNLFDTFFENETEIDSRSSNQEGFVFTDLSNSSQKMIHVTAKRITNCLKFIRIMLIKKFPVAKELQPKEVLDVISRGTTIHHCLTMKNEKSLADSQFSLLLNKVQIQLLELLRMFIIWLQTNALPFSFTISKILIDNLNKVQNCKCFTVDGLYQETLCKVFGCWLCICKNSFHTHFQTRLLTSILKDITPLKDNVTLSLQTDSKNKSAKAKRKFIQERIISSGQRSGSEKLTPLEKVNGKKNCLFALNTLKQLLTSTTLKVKGNVLQDLYNVIINAVLDLQTSKPISPYDHPDCEVGLYEVLVAFYEQETLKVLPPLQLTITILNKGISNRNRHIASICEHGLSVVEKLCQPICPSLNLTDTNISQEIEQVSQSLFNKHTLDYLENGMNGDEVTEANVVEDKDNLEENISQDIFGENGVENGQELIESNVKTDNEQEMAETESNMEFDDTNTTGDKVENTVPSDVIFKEKSVNIIDVQVVKSTENFQPTETIAYVQFENTNDVQDEENMTANDEAVAVDDENVAADDENVAADDENVVTDVENVVTRCTIFDESIGKDEPPPKRAKIDQEIDDFKDTEIKEEATSAEEIDDLFEEDGAFVDEIKEC